MLRASRRTTAGLLLPAVLSLHAALAAPVLADDWPQWGGRPERNMVAEAKGLPDTFNPRELLEPEDGARDLPLPRNVRWSAALGSQTFGNPTVAGGRVFVGTNNARPRDPRFSEDRSVVTCLRESDGQFLWQLPVPKIPAKGKFNGDYKLLGITSSPTVQADRVYVVTNRCEVLCLDANGLADGNDGPFTDEALYLATPKEHTITEGPDGPVVTFTPGEAVELGPADADILWRFDMIAEVKSWPQDASDCSPLVYGDYVYVATSNGVDKSHKHIPSPKAPSLIALDKRTGALVAADDAALGPRIFHGQWSSPSLGVVNGRALVFYGGGDGFCYAFDAEPVPGKDGAPGTLRKVWWFDCNPPGHKVRDGQPIPYKTKGDGPSEIIATPVFYNSRVYVTVGQDPGHGTGKGCLSCIDATGTGDVSRSGSLWTYTDMDRSLSTVSIADGLLYVADYAGILHCLDADSGRCYWKHDTDSHVWASTLAADGKIYLGTEKGDLWVLAAGKECKVLTRIRMGCPVYTTPIVANGVLYVTSQKHLYAVQAGRP